MALRADIAMKIAADLFKDEEKRNALLTMPYKKEQVFVTSDDNVLRRPPRQVFIDLGLWPLMKNMTVSLIDSVEGDDGVFNHRLTPLGRDVQRTIAETIAAQAELQAHIEQFTCGQIWADHKKRSKAEYIFIINNVEYDRATSLTKPHRIHGLQISTTTDSHGDSPETRSMHPNSLAKMAPFLWFNPVKLEIEDK